MNCKHGLDNRQEMQARRLRALLESNDEKTIQNLTKLYLKYIKNGGGTTFLIYLRKYYLVEYSAITRIEDKDKIFTQIINKSI